MAESAIAEYLRSLQSELRRKGLSDPDTLAEIESHLLDSLEAGLTRGLSPVDAHQQALERFGAPRLLAEQFAKQRKQPMQKIYFGLALAAGLLIAYVDALPHWDDTGITVFALLLSGGVIGLLVQRRPWLFGVAIGLWLPLYYIFTQHNFSILIVGLFPLAAVYAGYGLRRLVRRTLHSA